MLLLHFTNAYSVHAIIAAMDVEMNFVEYKWHRLINYSESDEEILDKWSIAIRN